MDSASSIALFDNSAFMGVMRSYIPELEPHRIFIKNYPEHKLIDEISIAQFLHAICVFDELQLDAASKFLPDTQFVYNEEGYVNEADEENVQGVLMWVTELLEFLPDSLMEIIMPRPTQDPDIDDIEACERAYDLLCSDYARTITDTSTIIPKVYNYDSSYVYKPIFEKIHEENGSILSDELLTYAMFLHRGIYLQNRSMAEGVTYIPYLYRGKMLKSVSPLISVPTHTRFLKPRLPLVQGKRPNEDELLISLNKFYYELLDKVCWTTYDETIPFIGAAILAKAKGDVENAFSIALDIRGDGRLRFAWQRLSHGLKSGRRGNYEVLLSEFRNALEKAAMHLGADIPNPQIETLYKLAVAWAPENFSSITDAAISILPRNFRHWANRFANRLLFKDPFQLLFIEHAEAVWSS